MWTKLMIMRCMANSVYDIDMITVGMSCNCDRFASQQPAHHAVKTEHNEKFERFLIHKQSNLLDTCELIHVWLTYSCEGSFLQRVPYKLAIYLYEGLA